MHTAGSERGLRSENPKRFITTCSLALDRPHGMEMALKLRLTTTALGGASSSQAQSDVPQCRYRVRIYIYPATYPRCEMAAYCLLGKSKES